MVQDQERGRGGGQGPVLIGFFLFFSEVFHLDYSSSPRAIAKYSLKTWVTSAFQVWGGGRRYLQKLPVAVAGQS